MLKRVLLVCLVLFEWFLAAGVSSLRDSVLSSSVIVTILQLALVALAAAEICRHQLSGSFTDRQAVIAQVAASYSGGALYRLSFVLSELLTQRMPVTGLVLGLPVELGLGAALNVFFASVVLPCAAVLFVYWIAARGRQVPETTGGIPPSTPTA